MSDEKRKAKKICMRKKMNKRKEKFQKQRKDRKEKKGQVKESFDY